MNIASLRERASQIKQLVEDLRAESYTVVQFNHEGNEYMFIASFNIETGRMECNVTGSDFIELKALSQIPLPVLTAYGTFVSNILDFENGAPLVYANSDPSLKPLSVSDIANRASKIHTEEHIDDDEARLR